MFGSFVGLIARRTEPDEAIWLITKRSFATLRKTGSSEGRMT